MHALVRLILVVALIGVTGAASPSREALAPSVGTPPAIDQAAVTRLLGQAPLLFVEDGGRSGPNVRYLARGAGTPLWLADDGVWLTLGSYKLVLGAQSGTGRLQWDCTSPDPKAHWTTDDEVYCWQDYFAIIDALRIQSLEVVDPATVAVRWGRVPTVDIERYEAILKQTKARKGKPAKAAQKSAPSKPASKLRKTARRKTVKA